ncbi:MAG: hypothetical protein AVDCRST_MAG89-1039, partial [uncultured Gemmatimonadetes bacterium]
GHALESGNRHRAGRDRLDDARRGSGARRVAEPLAHGGGDARARTPPPPGASRHQP